MSVVGIVGEYNPFHLGHAWHLRQTRAALGEDCTVVCVMSGDFVQRGEAALFSKFARAEAAVRCGVDLTVELPLPWSLSSAEGFARGAVSMLSGLGCDSISFGSEAGTIEPLEELAHTLSDPGLQPEIRERMKTDATLSYAAARQRLAAERLGEEKARRLETPNNILAVEYLKAIYELRAGLRPVTLRRMGNAHDGSGAEGFRSAAELRRLMGQGKPIDAHLPEAAAAVFRGEQRPDPQRLETAILSRLRWLPEAAFDSLPDAGEGLGRRLYRAAHEEATLDGVLSAAKSKRYALARLRRMLLCAALGVTAERTRGLPPYARVLAADAKGCELLRAASRAAELPVLTKPAAVRELSRDCEELFRLGADAHDLYVLGYPAPGERRGGGDWRHSPCILP